MQSNQTGASQGVSCASPGAERNSLASVGRGRLLDHRHNRRGYPASLLGRLAASAPGAFFAPACRSGVLPRAPRRPPGRWWSGSEGTVEESGSLALGRGAEPGGLLLAALGLEPGGDA